MRSFATETTLRTDIAIRQAVAAKARGFHTLMWFISAPDAETAILRVKMRAKAGGHGAPSDTMRETFSASLANLASAVRVLDHVRCYDSTAAFDRPRLVAAFVGGRLTRRGDLNEAFRSALSGLVG